MPWPRLRKPAAPPSGVLGMPVSLLFEFLRREQARARGRSASAVAGERQARGAGDGVEFERLRPFQPGDDVRRLDFRASVLSGSMQLRLFEARERLDTTIVLDRSESMACPPAQPRVGRPDPFWLGCQIALAIAWLAVRRHERATILLPATDGAEALQLGPTHTQAGLLGLHRTLLAVRPRGRQDPAKVEERLRRDRRHRGLLVMISDFLNLADGTAAAALRRLSSRGSPTVAIAVDGHRCELQDLRAYGDSALLVDCESPEQEYAVALGAETAAEMDAAADALYRQLGRAVDAPLNRVFRLDMSTLHAPMDFLLWLRRTLHAAGLF